MRKLGGQGLLVALFVFFLGLLLGFVRVPEHIVAVLGPFGTGQWGNVFGGGGQRVRASGLSARINQIKNLLVGQADARNRARTAESAAP